MEDKISLKEAFDRTGKTHVWIAGMLGIERSYYYKFIKRETITKPQALMIEKITGIPIEQIDIKVK